MAKDILEKVLSDLIMYYLGIDSKDIEALLQNSNIVSKDRVATIDDLQVIIYSSDHNPPHFHVKTKNLNIDAKFRIEDCQLISGNIQKKDLKKIKAFYLSPKGKYVLQLIWVKRKNAI